MKLLVRIVLVLVGIVVLLLLVAVFVSKDYSIQRDITINKPRTEVFDYIRYQKNQEQYNKWIMEDPNLKKQYRGTDGTVGFATKWDSEKKEVGKGEQEIKQIVEGERVDSEIRFVEPFESVAQTHMTTEAVSPSQTKVTWTFEGRNSWPMNLMNLFMNNMLGKDMQTSLENLKKNMESR